jgi:hypothetical protein
MPAGLQHPRSRRLSYQSGEVQDENSSAVRGNHQIECQGKLNQYAITVKEAWAMSSNLLDYPEENRLK